MPWFARFKRDPNDREAFAGWYREVYPALFMTAYRVAMGNRAAAEDFCHEVIVAFVTRGGLRKVKDEQEALAYLKRAVVNEHIDSLRARRHEVNAEPPEAAADPQMAESLDIARRYETLLETLDPADRELLGMMIAGHTLTEIAQALGISYSNAGVRVHRIRNKINKLYEH